MQRLPLRRRDGTVAAYVLVDDEDYEALARHRWYLNGGYAIRTTYRPKRQIMMHRVILGLSYGDGLEGDHINRDKLDNRRKNLRVATKAQNHQNRDSYKGSSSRFRGVARHKMTGRWQANVRIDGKLVYLGLYDSEEAAARVAAEYRREHMAFAAN